MRRAIFYWISCLAVLAAGAAVVCPAGNCAVGEWDRAGLALADALRGEALDSLMRALTWLGSLLVLAPLALVTAAWLSRAGRRIEAGFVVVALAGASAGPSPLPLRCSWSAGRAFICRCISPATCSPVRWPQRCGWPDCGR